MAGGFRGWPTAVAAISLVVLNTAVWVVPFYVVLVPKLLVRHGAVQRAVDRFYIVMSNTWIRVNRAVFDMLLPTRWDIEYLGDPDPAEWVVLTVNHRSWTDPIALVQVIHERLAFPKFFAKKGLVWLPFFGQAFWALGFPLMARHSAEHLARNPEARGQDLEATRRAVRRFRYRPVSVVNFLEGTRFTPEKHARTHSPFRHLLPPKAGGVAAVIAGLGDRLQAWVDVTIVYPEGHSSFWDFLGGRLEWIHVRVERIAVPDWFLGGDYSADSEYREALQEWVRSLWERKDAHIDAVLKRSTKQAARPEA